MTRYAIGIDVHKRTCTAHIVCADYGEQSNNATEFIKAFNREFGNWEFGRR